MFWIASIPITVKSRKRASSSPGAPSKPTLDKIRAGQSVTVTKIVAGSAANLQLAQLGIRTGSALTVRRSAPLGGPVMVESGGSLVAIGRGMARKVHVQTLE